MLRKDFITALGREPMMIMERRITVLTGLGTLPMLEVLATQAMDYFPGLDISLVACDTLEPTCDMAIGALCHLDLGEELLITIPEYNMMLEQDKEAELTLMTALEVMIRPTHLFGADILNAYLGREH